VKLGTADSIIDARGRIDLLEAWERRLRARYKLKSTEVLYEAIRHADFHETGNGPGEPDKLEHWNLAAYAAFSGIMVQHKLSPEQLRDLLADFRARHDLGLAKKKKLSTAEFVEEIEEALTEDGFNSFDHDGSHTRQLCDYIGVAHRYQCASSDRYDFPHRDRFIAGRMTSAQQQTAFGEAVHLQIQDLHRQGIPGFGSFDVKRPAQRIVTLGHADRVARLLERIAKTSCAEAFPAPATTNKPAKM